MKKVNLLLMVLAISFGLHSQTLIKYNQLQPAFGNNTTYLGSSDNRSLYIKTNGAQVAKFDSVGLSTFSGTLAATRVAVDGTVVTRGYVELTRSGGLNTITAGTVNGIRLGGGTSSQLMWVAKSDGYTRRIASTLTSHRDYTFPDSTGRVCITQHLASYVPYTGATTSLNLGSNAFITSSTATITGAAKQTNTLNYEGNTTWNTNQTNTLTTGNTGTVAVLSDAVFTTKHIGGAYNPADGTTYYIGTLFYTMSTNRTGGVYIPYNATIVGFTSTNIVGATGSSETYTLQVWVNNTTATNLSTSINSTAAVNTFSNSANVSVAAGDYIETRIITPTWVTNPTTQTFEVTLFYVRRQ